MIIRKLWKYMNVTFHMKNFLARHKVGLTPGDLEIAKFLSP
jgi:hypothetical protein